MSSSAQIVIQPTDAEIQLAAWQETLASVNASAAAEVVSYKASLAPLAAEEQLYVAQMSSSENRLPLLG